jgi:hypothetical protein
VHSDETLHKSGQEQRARPHDHRCRSQAKPMRLMVLLAFAARGARALRSGGGARAWLPSLRSPRPSLAPRRTSTLDQPAVRPFLGAGEALPSKYDFSTEGSLYAWWEAQGLFEPSDAEHPRGAYTCPMPPPNVTGRLHLGHAMFVALQDILARFHRARGRPTLWLPAGQDKRAKFPTSKPHISAVFHSFRLIFGRAIISRNGLEAWMLFPERARAEHSR